MGVFISKPVKKWMTKQRDITIDSMLKAADEITRGQYDGDLGGGVFKKRIANRKGRSKRGCSRLIIAYKQGSHTFFLFAYNKNDVENVTPVEKKALQVRAKLYFGFSKAELSKAVDAEILFKIRS